MSRTPSLSGALALGLVASFVVGIRGWSGGSLSRRELGASAMATVAGVVFPENSKAETDELPMFLRDFTKLAPLGKVESSSYKTRGLSLEDLAKRLQSDLLQGSTGKGGYILSGDFSEDIFRDDCVFLDPNNRVASLSQCKKALEILFDPARSQVRLLEPLTVDSDVSTIAGKFRVRGFLQFPWNPFVTAYESNILYKIDDDGLVYEQVQAWTKSASEALQESFTPTIFTPPPSSTLAPSPNEPVAETALFDICNGRRPEEYSAEERTEIASLMDQLAGAKYDIVADVLPGTWKLVFLQPGPTGAGVDRRVPFPEFSFNDQYQIFEKDSVVNVGEIFGPSLAVRVFGDLAQVDPDSRSSPKRFAARINGGTLCWKETTCVDLPISGDGLFDILYLGGRIRVLQNIDGGGARGVQVRMS